MENKNSNKKIFIIIAVVIFVGITAIITINAKNNNSSDNNINDTNIKASLTQIQVQNLVMEKVNNNDIYINDVGKIKSIENVKYIETIDNIEYWKMDLEYELSSLSAPIGKNYSGTSLKGTFCFAYNTENKKCYEYMFEMNDYETLKGWSKTNKNKVNSWK